MRTYYLALLALFEVAVMANPVANPTDDLAPLMKRQSSSATTSAASSAPTYTGAHTGAAVSLSSGTYTYPDLVPTAVASINTSGGQRQTTGYNSVVTSIPKSELGTANWSVKSASTYSDVTSTSTHSAAATALAVPRQLDSNAVPLLGALVYLLVGF